MVVFLKITTIYGNQNSNLEGDYKKGLSYDPQNTPKTTIKEDTMYNSKNANINSGINWFENQVVDKSFNFCFEFQFKFL